jgi:hypothetical protein
VPPLESWRELKCTCKDNSRPVDDNLVARPVAPPAKINGQCSSFARIALHLDLSKDGQVILQKREQFVDRDARDRDFNDMGGYELCDGKELTPPTSASHCSVGSRMSNSSACMTRLEQLTYDEASVACKSRGGRLAKIQNLDEAIALQEFGDNMDLGIGLRDYGADDDWRFDDNATAKDAVAGIEGSFSRSEMRRRFTPKHFKRSACVAVTARRRKQPVLKPISCESKASWVCEGTLANPSSGQAVVQGDLLADEGAFCLWHAHEPVDLLPNDEGKNFRNTDLQCHLQTSSREKKQCEFIPNNRRRGLVKKRGSRFNAEHYPVKGSTIGWQGSKANMAFLKLENADDHFHCHYSPSNNGLLRIYAMQHMFDRNYVGSMRKTCGCGYKHLAQLVSRCDCTRSGRRDNNCARWHAPQLAEATNGTHAVRCNNCKAKHNL